MLLLLIIKVIDTAYHILDLNARCSDKQDLDTPYSPHIPNREIIDMAPCNSHGKSLVEFLVDYDLCMLNGRFAPSSNKFTCVSTKGASVVDYVIIPIRDLHRITKFSIHYI